MRGRLEAQKDYKKIAEILDQDETHIKTIPKTHKEFVSIEKSLEKYSTIPNISMDLEDKKTRANDLEDKEDKIEQYERKVIRDRAI